MSAVQYCPVCPTPSPLRVLDPHLLRLPLKRCDTCLGVLADPATVAVAATHYHSVHYVMSEGHGRHHCRHCNALFERVLQRCRTCLKEQALSCVRCHAPMQVIEVAGVSLDVCRPCRMVWFDRGELGLLTRRHSAELQRSLHPAPAGFQVGVIDVAQNADAGVLAAELAGRSGEVALRTMSEVSASSAMEVVTAAGEGAIDVTAGVLDVLVSVLGDIF